MTGGARRRRLARKPCMALHVIYVLYSTFASISNQISCAFEDMRMALVVNFEKFPLLFTILVIYQLYYYLSC